MGTRADFYVGTGINAEWLGSVALDGYEWQESPDCPLMKATTEDEFRAAVKNIAAERKDWTSPEQGWPWPWDDSFTTDRAYAFVDGKTQDFHFGKMPPKSEDDVPVKTVDWPNMKDRKNVTLGPCSGIVFTRKQEPMINRRTLFATAILAVLHRPASETTKSAIARNLRRELNRRGWTIGDLSERMMREQRKYTRRYLEQTLTDAKPISLVDTANIAETLGVEIGDLLA